MGFYDNFKIIPPDIPSDDSGLEHSEDYDFINDYINTNYNLNLLKAGVEDDDPFAGIAPDPEEASIDNESSSDPGSMDNNELGSDELGGNPFDNLIDENSFGNDEGDDMGDPDQQTDEQQQNNDQIKVDREKLLRASYSLGSNIRKIFPPRFNELKEILSNNIETMSRTEFSDTKSQEVVVLLIKSYEKQIELIRTFQDIIIDQPFDAIFRKYVEIFTNCLKLKEAYKILLEEDANTKSKKAKK